MWSGGGFEDANLGIKTTIPISFLGDLKPEEVLTIDEQREILGKDPLENDSIMAQIQTNERSNNSN